MARLNVDLTDSLNWNRFVNADLTAERRESGAIVPIPPISATAPSPLILVAGQSPTAPANWQLAAWCQPAISVNPGSLAGFMGLGFLPRQAVLLNNYALIQCPQFEGASNYLYKFTPVPWLGALYLEAWWYDGPVTTDVQNGITELLQRS